MTYDEKDIRVLTDSELESHSVDSMLAILLEEFPDTAINHLERVSECLLTLGFGVKEYREYREGKLEIGKLETMQMWFKEMNQHKGY